MCSLWLATSAALAGWLKFSRKELGVDVTIIDMTPVPILFHQQPVPEENAFSIPIVITKIADVS